jgi:hypothetical protein
MKRLTMVVALIILSSVACSLGLGPQPTEDVMPTAEQAVPTVESAALTTEPATVTRAASPTETLPESEKRCGDGVCDGPENPKNCPEDCSEDGGAVADEILTPPLVEEIAPESTPLSTEGGDPVILYHLAEHNVASNTMGEKTCYMFSFRRWLDGGFVGPDGSENQMLELKDNPTSKLRAKLFDSFYYISTPKDPLQTLYGMEMFNWDVEEQTLWSQGFTDAEPSLVQASQGAEFPGGVAVAPGNRYVVFLMTQRTAEDGGQAGGFMPSKYNPFASDSSLIVTGPDGTDKAQVVSAGYNRQLFTSFSDFSLDGRFFYTVVRKGEGFGLVRLDLDSKQVGMFEDVFPRFDAAQVPWDQIFPGADDFAYGYFTFAPDETRLVAYKNYFKASLDNPCFSEATHRLWVFNLEDGSVEASPERLGYVTDAEWNPESTQLAFAVVGNSGCYPDYLDSRIVVLDRDGQETATLVVEPKSKMTTLGWSPDGKNIAYDVYGTDFVGRIKLIDVSSGDVSEVVNTEELGYVVDWERPVTFLFADWVLQDR